MQMDMGHWRMVMNKYVFQVWQCGQCSAPCALFPTREGLESHVEREHPFEGTTAFDCGKCASAR